MDNVIADSGSPALVPALEENMQDYWIAYGDAAGCERYDTPELAQFITGIPHPFFNAAFAPRLTDATADTEIEGAIARARARQVPLFWWIGPSAQRDDLAARLARHGVKRIGGPPGMAVDLGDLPAELPTPPGVTVARVRDADGLAVWMQTLLRGYKLSPDLYDPLFAIESETMRRYPFPERGYYIAYQGDEPVAVSALHASRGVAGIFAVVTVAEARGRGIGGAVTLAPLLAARDTGYRVGVLQASDMGQPVYRRIGFRDVCAIDLYLWRGE